MARDNKDGKNGDNTNSEDDRFTIESNKEKNNRTIGRNDSSLGSDRWTLFLGIGLMVLGIVLLTLRSVLFSLILIIAGVSVFTYWLYSNARQREGKPKIITGADKHDEECLCSICGHRVSGTCFEYKCACCLLMRENKVIGHSNNPLQ